MAFNLKDAARGFMAKEEMRGFALSTLKQQGLSRRDARVTLARIEKSISDTGVNALLSARTLFNHNVAGRPLNDHDKTDRANQLEQRARMFVLLRRARSAEDSYAATSGALPAEPVEIARSVRRYLSLLDASTVRFQDPDFYTPAGLFNGASPVGSGVIF